jgi:hypothetical protein
MHVLLPRFAGKVASSADQKSRICRWGRQDEPNPLMGQRACHVQRCRYIVCVRWSVCVDTLYFDYV